MKQLSVLLQIFKAHLGVAKQTADYRETLCRVEADEPQLQAAAWAGKYRRQKR